MVYGSLVAHVSRLIPKDSSKISWKAPEDFDCRPGDVVLVPRTGEVMLIKECDRKASSWSVKRAWGKTDPTYLISGDELLVLGNAAKAY